MLELSTAKILNVFFPPKCHVCDDPLSGTAGRFLCPACADKIRWIEPPFCPGCGCPVPLEELRCPDCRRQRHPFDRAFACALYEGPIRRLMHDFKFGYVESLHDFFGPMLCDFAGKYIFGPASAHTPDTVIGVPLNASKLRRRGFCQTHRLAAHLSRRFGLGDLSKTLERLRSGQDQARLAKNARGANIKDCFRIRDNASLASKRILLVDDILTTGQTAAECARALKKAGAASVWVLACARGDRNFR